MAIQANDYTLLMYVLCRLGDLYVKLANPESGEQSYRQSLLYAEAHTNWHCKAAAFVGLGNIRRGANDFEQALTYYDDALKIQRKLGDCRGMAASMAAMAEALSQQGNYQEAIHHLECSITLSLQGGNRRHLAKAYSILADILEKIGRHEDAKRCNEQSREYEGLGYE